MANSFFGDTIAPNLLMALIQARQGRRSAELQDRSLDQQREQFHPGRLLTTSLIQGLAAAPGQALASIPGQLIAGGQARERQLSDQQFQAGQNEIARKANLENMMRMAVAEGRMMPNPLGGGGFMSTQPMLAQQAYARQVGLENLRSKNQRTENAIPRPAPTKPGANVERVMRAREMMAPQTQSPFAEPTSPYYEDLELNESEAGMVTGMERIEATLAGLQAKSDQFEQTMAHKEAELAETRRKNDAYAAHLQANERLKEAENAIARLNSDRAANRAGLNYDLELGKIMAGVEADAASLEQKYAAAFTNPAEASAAIDSFRKKVAGIRFPTKTDMNAANARSEILGLSQRMQAFPVGDPRRRQLAEQIKALAASAGLTMGEPVNR